MAPLYLTADTQTQLMEWLHEDTTLVACLCAAWCDVCRDYRPIFTTLAERLPDVHFVWIDIEDQADLLGDFDIENFPTLLIQRGQQVAFFGSVQPGLQLAERLVQAQAAKSSDELNAEANSSAERRRWQEQIHLSRRLDPTAG